MSTEQTDTRAGEASMDLLTCGDRALRDWFERDLDPGEPDAIETRLALLREKLVRRVRIVPVADAAEAELRIRLDERRSFGPLVQRIAEEAAANVLRRVEEVADIVKRERPFLPPCVVEDIRDAAGWARETAEAERERAADESLSSMTRSVSRECAAKYDRLAKIAELHLEGRPQPEAVPDWTDAQVDAAFEEGRSEHVPRYLVERMLNAALRATQEGR